MQLARISESTSERDFVIIYNNAISDIEREFAKLGKEIKLLVETRRK